LEDDPKDTALIQSALEAGGIGCVITRVQSRDEFVAALERGSTFYFSVPKQDGGINGH